MSRSKLTVTHKVTIAVALIGAAATIGVAIWKTQGAAIINNQGIVSQEQTGGVNTVINRQPPRHIDDELRGFIRANVPKSKAIKIMVLNGDSERDDFAGEIANFLTGDGYDVKSPLLSFLVGSGGKTPSGVEIGPEANPDNGTWIVKVGVNTR
jgi:hypothetical protein